MLERAGGGLSARARLRLVASDADRGYYAETLTETKRQDPFRPVSVYASTCEVLAWLRSLLADGSILLFDDWHVFGDDLEVGQPKAFGEFLAANQALTAEPLLDFGRHGKGFVMRQRPPA